MAGILWGDKLMSGVLSVLNPAEIKKSEFEKIITEIAERLKFMPDVHEIRKFLDDYGDKPYYFKKNGIYMENGRCTPSIRDAASFYVLIKYLEHYKSGTNSGAISTEGSAGGSFEAARYYLEFFGDKWDDEKEFIYSFICNEPGTGSDLFSDLNIDIVSGSVYKIKKYFLENSRIKDIRGGSALIKHVNEDVTFRYLREKYTEECAIYCGGGNALIIAPGGTGADICRELEEEYTQITLTAQNAFECVRTNLNKFIRDYKEIMRDLNQKLDERKKLKIFDINPDNDKKQIETGSEVIKFDAEKIEENGVVCYLCGVRDAKYKVSIPENAAVCPSCLRKRKMGENKAVFYDEYRKYTGASVKRKINSLDELEDDNGRIAVIYADGNNMGNVVKSIETPFQHMYFSRTLDRTTKKCVYKSINEVMGSEAMFEAIALGGDDIFIVVPGDKSLVIANKIIEKFDSEFEYKMTMSAGICIARSSTPIRTMFEVAQHMLKSAKKYSRKNNNSKGTVDVQVIRSNTGIDLLESESSLFPADNSELSDYLDIREKMKSDNDIKPSQLYKFSNAWRIMKNPLEFQLFYLYQTGRVANRYNGYVIKFLNSRKGINRDAYSYCGLIQKKPDAGSDGEPQYMPLWDDIILLMDAVGR